MLVTFFISSWEFFHFIMLFIKSGIIFSCMSEQSFNVNNVLSILPSILGIKTLFKHLTITDFPRTTSSLNTYILFLQGKGQLISGCNSSMTTSSQIKLQKFPFL